MQIAKCKLQSAGPRPPAPSTQPRGISLVEVLIAMGILTVGLLGVASIFPVAAFYIQKGDVADHGSAIAQAAFNDALSRGMLDPSTWLMGGADSIGYVRYTKSFKDGLRDEIVAQTAAAPLLRNQMLNGRFGYAYVIDPLGVEGSPKDATNQLSLAQVLTTQRFPFNAAYYSGSPPAWWPWNPAAPGLAVYSPKWPLVRLTLPQAGPSAPWPMTATVADRLFVSSDDLTLDVPSRSDRPSVQLLDLDKTTIPGSTIPLARQSHGDYSWIVTIVPPSADARNALASNPAAYEYEVSVAVFYKRIIDNLLVEAAPSERLTKAMVVSTGLNGGEMLVEGVTTSGSQKPFDELKVGNWVAVCGPHPASTNDMPRFVMRWYRVLSIDGKDRRLNDRGTDSPPAPDTDPERRLVTLRGPQWPWQPAPGGLTDYNHLSNNVCVAIIPHVVAVHSKTIRLENNSSWSVQ